MNQDEEHLRLLSIFHYVVGGITGLFACFPCFYLVLGVLFLSGAMPVQPNQQGMDRSMQQIMGWMFIVIASALILLGWSVAIAIFLSARFLARQTRYTFCLVVAALECLFMPLGTILGVFTIIVLCRPSVKDLFEFDDVALCTERT